MTPVQICKIKNQLKTCSEFMDTLDAKVFESKNVLLWFKQLCDHLTNLILLISELNKQFKGKLEKGNKDTLLLYLSQLISSLSLLINIFVKESDIQQILTEARLCARRQTVWCLDGIQETLTTNKSISDPSGSFIKWMDSALDTIAEIDINKEKTVIIRTCNDTKVLFEEVLSHAMSIAQVALKEDCEIIRGSSQTVLKSLDSLMQEINKPLSNPAMVNLFVDTCTDKLCTLERRVNTSVLKLSLKVFSEYTIMLDAIHDFCFNIENKGKMDELDMLVVDFDLHVDRIMQIGLFAVSCSSLSGRGVKIRSCLASLEALECELVPAFTSVLLDHSAHNVNLALLLKNHWLQQANVLRRLIYLIIDPFAFCQVIYEENQQIVDGISETVKTKQSVLHKESLNPLIDHSKVLLDFIDVVLKEEQKETDEIKITKQRFNDLRNVLHEVQSASSVLLGGNNSDSNFRILKRCKILLSTIKELWHCFIEESIENESNKDTQMSLDVNDSDKPATGNAFLDHIINRGKQILKERSILYRSSLKNDTFAIPVSAFKKITELKEQNKSLSLSKLVHLRKLSFMNSATKNESLAELQITVKSWSAGSISRVWHASTVTSREPVEMPELGNDVCNEQVIHNVWLGSDVSQ